jgi:protein-tyrosine phosphatase
MVKKRGLSGKIHVDSCGTGGWHAGDGPDDRMIHHAMERGYDLRDLEARQIRAPEDLREFDYILTMDNSNLKNVLALDVNKEHHHKVKPLTTFCRTYAINEVPDPYYRAADGFAHVLDLLEDACAELLTQIEKELK